MGGASSKAERSEALRLCKARKRLIKQVIDSRYAFAAAHLDYVQSLRNIGTSLRRFAEAEVLVGESSVSPELDKTPSQSSSPSPPSPSHIAADSPLSPPVSRLSYMISGGTGAVTFMVRPSSNGYVHDQESEAFAMAPPPPPPPPPPPGSGSSWDFFDPTDDFESFSFVEHNGLNLNFGDSEGHRQRQFSEREAGLHRGIHGFITPELEQKGCKDSINLISRSNRSNQFSEGNVVNSEVKQLEDDRKGNGKTLMLKATALEPSGSKTDKSVVKKKVGAKREDPSEFITHRAKDFLSSVKTIEHRFLRASESGKEVSRMLEANKIRIGYSEAIGGSSVLDQLAALRTACCQGKTSLVSHEHTAKFITWKRSASSKSSSSRNPPALASKDDNDDSGSDFVEDFCMIAGSHSSTLDRLYAWERKLYDEVKASESIGKEYDRKCDQLRHQFAKDISAQVMDKTRAVVKDLHSRIRVALHAVDSISKRIEKMRDDELLPQLVELVLGLIRMWNAMLECHHAQYITISLAYHAKSSTGTLRGDMHRQIMTQLQDEIECFGQSFANWINSHTSYVEALNGWLQSCILQPQERSKGRRAFSPRRVLAPPIFVLCRNWSAGLKALPSEELNDAIKGFLGDLCQSIEQQVEEPEKKQRRELDSSNVGESEFKADGSNNDNSSPSLSSIHSSLAKVLDRLTKFSEASLKMYDGIRQKSESAQTAYSNYKKPPRSSCVI